MEDTSEVLDKIPEGIKTRSVKKYLQKYKESWESDPYFSGWLTRSEKGEHYAYCGACGIDIRINGGSTDIRKHGDSKKHKLCCKYYPEIFMNIDEEDKEIKLENEKGHSFKRQRPSLFKYNLYWERKKEFSSWVSRSRKGKCFAFCKVCNEDILVVAGITSIRKHHNLKHTGAAFLKKQGEEDHFIENVNGIQIKVLSDDSFLETNIDENSVKKKKYIQKYCKKWELDPQFRGWLTSSSKSAFYAYCKACKVDLLIRGGGRCDILHHGKGKKHLKMFQHMMAHLGEVPYLEADYLRDSIKRILPRTEDDVIEGIITLLLGDYGVESKQDLFHIEAEDLLEHLKLVPARKLVYSWKAECRKFMDPPPDTMDEKPADILSASLNSAAAVASQLQFNPATSVTTTVDANGLEENLTMPYLLTVQDDAVHTMQADTFNKNLRPDEELHSVKIPDPLTLSNLEEKQEISCLEGSIPASKASLPSEWVGSFTIPSESLTPNLLNSLQNGEKLSESKLGELVRVLADSIYKIVTKPLPDDIRSIAERITLEFPSLQDKHNDCHYESVFVKLRNRLYFLRKRKAKNLRKSFCSGFTFPWKKLTEETSNFLINGCPLEDKHWDEVIVVVSNEIPLLQADILLSPEILRALSHRIVTTVPILRKDLSEKKCFERFFRDLRENLSLKV